MRRPRGGGLQPRKGRVKARVKRNARKKQYLGEGKTTRKGTFCAKNSTRREGGTLHR